MGGDGNVLDGVVLLVVVGRRGGVGGFLWLG